MDVIIEYWAECPNWPTAVERTREAARRTGIDAIVTAVERDDALSPTILIGGEDAFGTVTGGPGCRVYMTADGPQGSPSVSQLEDVLRAT